MNTKPLCVFAFLTLLWSVGATSAEPLPDTGGAQREKIAEDSCRVRSRLYESAPGLRDLVATARGLLIFPTVLSAGETTGGQYAEGELIVDGKPVAFNSAIVLDLEPQRGAKSKAVLVLLFTQDALVGFRTSDEWMLGAD